MAGTTARQAADSDIRKADKLYQSRPLRNRDVREQPAGAGLILHIPLKDPHGPYKLLAWLAVLPRRRTIELDALGRTVYAGCDGQRTVRDLIEWFRTRHALTFHEARLCIVSYLKRLIECGAIAVAVPEPGQGERA